MSLFPDITPLVNEVKQFNQTQALILTELREIKELLKNASITEKK